VEPCPYAAEAFCAERSRWVLAPFNPLITRGLNSSGPAICLAIPPRQGRQEADRDREFSSFSPAFAALVMGCSIWGCDDRKATACGFPFIELAL
jgi:hypothetical protein